MTMGTVFNYIIGSNNGPGKVDPSGYGDRGHALMKTADTGHAEATAQGGADRLNSAPDSNAIGHDSFNRTQADHYEWEQNNAQWSKAQGLLGR